MKLSIELFFLQYYEVSGHILNSVLNTSVLCFVLFFFGLSPVEIGCSLK